jgi:uncharacterized protein
MNGEKPFIHLFKTQGGQYIFDVNTNSIIRTQDEAFGLLQDMLNNYNNCDELYKNYESNSTIRKLKESGFLSSKKVREVAHPVSNVLEDYMGSKIRMIILQLTQQCNLRCRYCPYSGNYINRSHKNFRMSFETAKKGIEFIIDNSRDVDEINIGFYGGEPLLEFELMKKSILYTKEVSEGRKIRFSFTTNGTLFTKEIIEFLMSHDVQIAISLDGPKEVHDKNRKFAVTGCGTFEKIAKHLEYFKENYPEYFKKVAFNAVLDRSSSFSCVNEFFTGYDTIKDSLLLSSGLSTHYSKNEIDDRNEEYDVLVNYELFKMYLSKLGRLDEKHVSKLVTANFDILKKILVEDRGRRSELSDMEHHGGPCVPGTQRLFVDVNGNLFPCERVSEESDTMRIGHLDSGFDFNKVRNLLNFGKLTQDSCTNCWAFRFCTLCAAFADDLNELSSKKILSNCRDVRRTLEQQLKDYCMLNEFGYKFDESNFLQAAEG